jgi:hypothetical protein
VEVAGSLADKRLTYKQLTGDSLSLKISHGTREEEAAEREADSIAISFNLRRKKKEAAFRLPLFVLTSEEISWLPTV